MRAIEAKARLQEIVMYWAAAWLEDDPNWTSHQLSVRWYPYCRSVWRRRAVRKKALRRIWHDKRRKRMALEKV